MENWDNARTKHDQDDGMLQSKYVHRHGLRF